MRVDAAPLSLFVVIPVHNRRAYTMRCLGGLEAQTRSDFSVIVVDDGSCDGTAEMVRSAFPRAVLLTGDGSLWWTGATNWGIAYALGRGATHILCLNDDTAPAADLIERLIETAVRFPDALNGASFCDAATGQPCFRGERARWLTAGARSLLHEAAGQRIVEVTHAPGRALLIPRAVFERIGSFDAAHFPQSGADYDFTHRARRAGFRILCDRAAVLAMYPEACGEAAMRAHPSWANYRRHLFDRKGGANLRVLFWYALRNCPWPLLPACLVAGVLRHVGGYPLQWARKRWRAAYAGART